MNYEQTLNYIFEKLPMFSRVGAAAYKADLDNTIALCNAINNPQQHFKTIHIAGTNGKGSVSHMLAAVLQSAGYKTGLYTSPHLKDFRERIKINGELCSEDFVVDFVQRIQPQIESIEPSFFEITVAMAFDCFAQQKVDIAIIETGLGGRLDSTNIITPELSIITNISLDHVQFLGNTLAAIAGEKAGIIKQNIPVVIGEKHAETNDVFITTAAVKQSNIVFAQDEYYVSEFSLQPHTLQATIANKKTDEHSHYTLGLQGFYQTKNVLTVLSSLHQLKLQGWAINNEAITKGLGNVKKLTGLHGRWEQVHHNPTVIVDVAHNEAGMQQVLEQLELMTYNHLHFITGMVKDKDIEKVLSLLPKTATYYFTKAQIERALPENELVGLAENHGLQGNAFADVNEAINHALQHAHKDDLVLVCGSVFLAGEVDLLIV